MPKQVDHEDRRRELAEAVWRVIRRDGVQGASVRSVAAESGWSAGSLRHYFGSQQELLVFAVELVLERVPRRLQVHLASDGLDVLTRSRRLLEELLPLDDEREVEVLVYLAFADRARVDRALASVRARAWADTRQLCRLVVADLVGSRRPAAGAALRPRRHEDAAEQLHALLDGLTLQAISFPDQFPPGRARTVLHRALAALRP